MATPALRVSELRETHSVKEANALLETGWQLLEIACHWRGHIYILGVRTAVAEPAGNLPTLSEPADALSTLPAQNR